MLTYRKSSKPDVTKPKVADKGFNHTGNRVKLIVLYMAIPIPRTKFVWLYRDKGKQNEAAPWLAFP